VIPELREIGTEIGTKMRGMETGREGEGLKLCVLFFLFRRSKTLIRFDIGPGS
jgi:hypothetical protein